MFNKRTLWVCLITLFATALLLAPVSAQAVNPEWRGDYFANATLSGEPVVSRSDANIAFDWGTGSPVDGVPADDFSVRWGTDVALTVGTYRFTVQADDDIRVIFDYQDTPLIDTFGQGQAGQSITAEFTVATEDTYHIQVDYREITDNAYANVSLENLSGTYVFQSPELPEADVTATILAGRLNVRNAPSVRTGEIMTVVLRDEVYAVIATNEANSWYLIDTGELSGWVSGGWVTISPTGAEVPVESADTTAPEATAEAPTFTSEFVVTAAPFAVNIRSGAGIDNERLGRLPAGESAEAIGRSEDNSWWQINYNDITGWVSAEFALMAEDVDVSALPVTAEAPAAEVTPEATESA